MEVGIEIFPRKRHKSVSIKHLWISRKSHQYCIASSRCFCKQCYYAGGYLLKKTHPPLVQQWEIWSLHVVCQSSGTFYSAEVQQNTGNRLWKYCLFFHLCSLSRFPSNHCCCATISSHNYFHIPTCWVTPMAAPTQWGTCCAKQDMIIPYSQAELVSWWHL